MSTAPPKPRSRALLTVSLLLLVPLSAMLVYRWDEVKNSWQRWRTGQSGQGYFGTPVAPVEDATLLKELAEASLDLPETPADATSWSQWRGPARDGIASAANLLETWPDAGPPLAWKKPIGESFSAFVGGPEHVYTIVREDAQEVVLCWALDSGKEVWRYGYSCPPEERVGKGPRSTPSLVDGKLYTVGITGLFHCLDAATGKVLWEHDLLKEFEASNLGWGVSFSPLVEGKFVFTSPGGTSGGSLAAFDSETGNVLWKSQDDAGGYSSPVAVTFSGVRHLLFLNNSNLLGVNAETGKLLWNYPWPCTANAATPITITGQSKDGTPLLYVFISSNYGNGCALLKIERDGSHSFTARPVYTNGKMNNHFSTCVRQGDYLYGFSDAALTCLNLRDGVPAWTKQGMGKGSLLRVGDRLIVLGDAGQLALVKADPKSFDELASLKLRFRRTWTVPALIDGRLLVRDEEQVKCFDLRPK